jgi:hypothetical protein
MANKKELQLSDKSILPQPLIQDMDTQFISPRCKICKSNFRDEAEREYYRHNNISRVHKFLVEDRGLDVSITSVRNHMKMHFDAKENMKLMQEYANEVVGWIDSQSDDMTSIRRTMAILEREMFTLASKAEGASIEERRKTTDSINKLASTLLNHRTKILELEAKYEPVTMIFNQLQVIVEDELNHTKSKEVTKTVTNILGRLQDECSDMIVNQE